MAEEELLRLFDRAQHSMALQSASLRRLQALLVEQDECEDNASTTDNNINSNSNLHWAHLCAVPLSRVLLVPRLEPAVERLVAFFSKLLASASADPARSLSRRIQGALLRLLAGHVDAQDKTVRWRCCQLLGATLVQARLLSSPLPRAEARLVRAALASRLRDRVSQVRVHAAGALAVLACTPPKVNKEKEKEKEKETSSRKKRGKSKPKESKEESESSLSSEGEVFLDLDSEVVDDVDVPVLLASALECDDCAEVRVAILRALSPHPNPKQSLPEPLRLAVLARVRDVEASVRCAAVDAVARLLPWSSLLLEERVHVLDASLGDDDAKVRDKAMAMVRVWLHATKDKDKDKDEDALSLVRDLEPAQHEATAERLAAALATLAPYPFPFPFPFTLKSTSYNLLVLNSLDTRPYHDGELDEAKALQWRVLAAHVAARSDFSERERVFEALLPELPSLCMLLNLCQDKPFITRQLLLLALHVDVADEGGRRQLQGALLALLPSVRDESLLAPFVHALRHVTPDTDEFLREVVTVVSELREPLLRAKKSHGQGHGQGDGFNEQDEDEEAPSLSLSQGDVPWSPRAHGTSLSPQLPLEPRSPLVNLSPSHDLARTIHHERERNAALASRPDAEERWPTMLALTALLLGEYLGAEVNPMEDPTLSNLLEAVIVPAVRHASPSLRAPGVRCLGLFIMRDAKLSVHFAPLLLQALDKDVSSVRVEALQCVCNLLCVHGLAPFHDSEHSALDAAPDSPLAQSSLLRAVLRCASRADQELRAAAVEALCKLYTQRVLSDVRVLAKLLVDYNHPLTATFTRMRAVLRAFFSFLGSALRGAASLLERAYLEAVLQILESDPQSFTCRIDLVALSAPLLPLLAASSPWTQRRLALALCRLIDRSPLGSAGARLPALLPLLTFSLDATVDKLDTPLLRVVEEEEQRPRLRTLRVHVLRCLHDVHDKAAKAHLDKALKALHVLDSSPIAHEEVMALRVRSHKAKLTLTSKDKGIDKGKDMGKDQGKGKGKGKERERMREPWDEDEDEYARERAAKRKRQEHALQDEENEEQRYRHRQGQGQGQGRRRQPHEGLRIDLDQDEDEMEEEMEPMPMEEDDHGVTLARADSLAADELFGQSQPPLNEEGEDGDAGEVKRKRSAKAKATPATPRAALQREDSGLREVTSILSSLKRQLRDTGTLQPVLEDDLEAAHTEAQAPTSPTALIAELEKKLATLLSEQSRQKQNAMRKERTAATSASPLKGTVAKDATPLKTPARAPRTPAPIAATPLNHLTPAPSRDSVRRTPATSTASKAKAKAKAMEDDSDEDVFSFSRAFSPATTSKVLATPKSPTTPAAAAASPSSTSKVPKTPATSRKRVRSDNAADMFTEPKTAPRPAKRARRDAAEGPRVIRSAKGAESVLFPRRAQRQRVKASYDNVKHKESEREMDVDAEASPSPMVVLALTGFGKPGHSCTLERQGELLASCERVFGSECLRQGEQLAPDVTHVVAPLEVRTVKTLAALLSGRWLMSPEWLDRCLAAKSFLDEEGFGIHGSRQHFKGRSLHLTPDFIAEVGRRGVKSEVLKPLLAQLGKAKLVDDVSQADVVLVSSHETLPEETLIERTVWTWKELLEDVQPPHSRDA